MSSCRALLGFTHRAVGGRRQEQEGKGDSQRWSCSHVSIDAMRRPIVYETLNPKPSARQASRHKPWP